MDHYLNAGGNVIDTAELYARWVPGGEHQSEKVIGEWLRDRGVRDQVILSTKRSRRRSKSAFSIRSLLQRTALMGLGSCSIVSPQKMPSPGRDDAAPILGFPG
jgi:aryl-alcohol dehydrogenase-like predicted oxidoreductase